MKRCRANKFTPLFPQKGGNTPPLLVLAVGALLLDMEAPDSDEDWRNIVEFTDEIEGRKGWVRAGDITLDALPSDNDPVDPAIFTQEAVATEFVFNRRQDVDPFYADAEFMLAWARIESGLQNLRGAGPDQDLDGPYALSQADWADYVSSPFVLPGVGPLQRFAPLHQIAGAAFLMHNYAKRLSAHFMAAVPSGQQFPYVPRFGELLRCRLVGVENTVVMQRKLKDGEGDQLLPKFFAEQGMPAEAVDKLLAWRRRFMRSGGTATGDPLTLKGFHDKCAEILNNEFKEAFALIKEHVPEAIESAPKDGTAPWMDFARQELEAGISESAPDGQARIAQYFQATGFAGTAGNPWCGAFVAWCLQQCGGEIAKSFKPANAAAASSWLSWGDADLNNKTDAPVGAIVVMAASRETDEASHVGFFKSFDDAKRRVTLLGGNQSNKVSEVPFNASDIIAIRWLNAMTPAGAVAIRPGAPIPNGRENIAKIICDRFAAAGYGRIQQIAALANSIAESSLDPAARGDGGWSIGLFQCNMKAGEGVGHKKDDLEKPEYNTDVIIRAAKRYGKFADAKTIEKAVEIFVVNVERPKDTAGAIATRTNFARQLDNLL